MATRLERLKSLFYDRFRNHGNLINDENLAAQASFKSSNEIVRECIDLYRDSIQSQDMNKLVDKIVEFTFPIGESLLKNNKKE